MAQDKNQVEYTGEVVDKRECKRKDGSVWGHEISVAQLGDTLKVIVNEPTYNAITAGDRVVVTGKIKQVGYEHKLTDVRVGKPAPAKQTAAA